MKRKHILIFILALIQTAATFAQEWQVDFEKAKELATAQDKPIVMVFQGSDWCAPCIKLDKEIWSTEVFTEYAAEHYVMLQVDFPRRKKNKLSKTQSDANAKLAEAYNKNGIFPYVAIVDKEGKLLGDNGYKKVTPEAYIEELNSFIK